MTVPLFIPYLNRPDLLDKAVASVKRCKSVNVLVLNNSERKIPYLCNTPPVPLTFSQTQNWMLRQAENIHAPFYLFMHSDAEAGEGTVKKLVEMSQSLTDEGRKWGVIWTAYDALAAFNTAAFRAVGGWDQMLTWYLSEVDVYRRLRLAGYELIDSNLPVKHEPSQTLNSDPYIQMCVNLEVPFRERYYFLKWGGAAGRETYLTPFNLERI